MNKKYRIEWLEGGMMIGVATIYDALQAFLTFIIIGFLVNWIITIWAWLTFYFWFKFRGVSFLGTKSVSLNGGALIELIPGLNALPAWTAAVIILIIMTRSEDVLNQISPTTANALKSLSPTKKL